MLRESFVVPVPTGRTGPAVADVQKALLALGYQLPRHGVDGIRGPETVAAVKQFQQQHGLAVDGDPGPETVTKINSLLAADPNIAKTLSNSTMADVKSTARAGAPSAQPPLAVDSANEAEARQSAETFLGRKLDDAEWHALLRATAAESSPNAQEQAHVMAVILNRTRSGRWGDSVLSVLGAKNQFQAVTGTKFAPGPSKNYSRGPSQSQLNSMLSSAVSVLPAVDKTLMNFTAADPAAYTAGTDIKFRDTMMARGGQQIGGTIFGTV